MRALLPSVTRHTRLARLVRLVGERYELETTALLLLFDVSADCPQVLVEACGMLGSNAQLQAGTLGNVEFLEYTIVNKGSNTLDSAFVSLWSDVDLGLFTDDLAGCDTTLGLGYVYNSEPDPVYGVTPR